MQFEYSTIALNSFVYQPLVSSNIALLEDIKSAGLDLIQTLIASLARNCQN